MNETPNCPHCDARTIVKPAADVLTVVGALRNKDSTFLVCTNCRARAPIHSVTGRPRHRLLNERERYLRSQVSVLAKDLAQIMETSNTRAIASVAVEIGLIDHASKYKLSAMLECELEELVVAAERFYRELSAEQHKTLIEGRRKKSRKSHERRLFISLAEMNHALDNAIEAAIPELNQTLQIALRAQFSNQISKYLEEQKRTK